MGVMLPSEYQQVEYIESTGTQWIDTGIVPTSDLVAQITFMNIEGTGNVIFGFHGNRDSLSYRFFGDGNPYLDIPTGDGATYRIHASGLKTGVKYWLELGNHYIKLLDTGRIWVSKDSAPFADVTQTITLGYYDDIKISKNRWYEVLMSNDQGKLFHGIPCYRKFDAKAGMYDLVTGAFLTNQGTGEFTVGPDVIDSISPWLIARRRALMARAQSSGRLPAEYQEVEYLENLQSNAYLRIPKSYAYFAESTVCMQIEYLGSIEAESGFLGSPYVCELYIENNKIYHYFLPGFTLVVPTNKSAVSPNTKITITATVGSSNMSYMNVLTYRYDAYLFTGRLYYLYAIKDDIKIIDLVPCVRKADGVPGAYDLVNGGFFQSYTGTPFIVPN